MANTIEVEFYFEPVCGWAWRTSIWMRRVAKERPIHVNWKLLSLAAINSPEDWTKDANTGHIDAAGMNRTMVLARRKEGNDAMDRLFVAYGNAIFGTKELLTWGQRPNPSLRADINDPDYRALQAKCLETAGLPTTLYEDALADQSTHDDWMAENAEAVERLGAFGTPTIALAGSDVGIFGPVLEPVPSGAEALALWDSVYVALQAPFLYEIKRNRPRRTSIQFAD
jgi:predicted DsbA family dithiol-disulfide isomerase